MANQLARANGLDISKHGQTFHKDTDPEVDTMLMGYVKVLHSRTKIWIMSSSTQEAKHICLVASALVLHSTRRRPRALTIDVARCSGASMLILVQEIIIMTCLQG
ncbi:8fe57eb1-bf8d-488d-8616-5c94d2f84c79 [Sclerotinia trifoliorum]|uniref:8fe57eb1-bf8d-488d-8616-5c94d2f84c79 n=1 Tax=Sclerotinia trifoliorum TaxID=28548 RepID=A0A8H2VW49_9HELO|nr:8fe57eb1-bf8d-488d-8616-5c94d2f84c79 [Sclerotinia trifoliorum]